MYLWLFMADIGHFGLKWTELHCNVTQIEKIENLAMPKNVFYASVPKYPHIILIVDDKIQLVVKTNIPFDFWLSIILSNDAINVNITIVH